MAGSPVGIPAITDASPQLHIPEPQKNRLPLLALIVGLVLAGLVIGHVFGRVSHARLLYNKTIQDANRIQEFVQKVSEVDGQVVSALKASAQRGQGKISYDEELVADLNQVRSSPLASPEGLKRLENALFRTNYAMMDDLLIHRLFSYYNNFVRLMLAVRNFTEEAEARRDEIVDYAKGAANADRNYGVVLAEDKGSFFIGRLVEVGQTVCSDKKAMASGQCKADDIAGFQVRVPGADRWTQKAGRPERKGNPAGIVVPIAPDETWQSVATARPGYLEYAAYLQRYRSISGISAALSQDRKALLESLKKQAGRDTLFAL